MRTLCFEAYGVQIGLRVGGAIELNRIRSRLPPGWHSCASQTVGVWFSLLGPTSCERKTYHLSSPTQQICESTELCDVIDELDWQLRLHVALHAPELLFVHAGVVGWRDHAIVIPGRTYTGKTSLVAALIEAGAIYYSDEYAVIDKRGYIHPYPRPLSVRGAIGDRPQFCGADHFGAVAGIEPLRVGLIVVTSYEAGASWQPDELTPAAALMAMLDNTVAARSRPSLTLSTLGAAVKRSKAIRSKRGEARLLAAELLVR